MTYLQSMCLACQSHKNFRLHLSTVQSAEGKHPLNFHRPMIKIGLKVYWKLPDNGKPDRKVKYWGETAHMSLASYSSLQYGLPSPSLTTEPPARFSHTSTGTTQRTSSVGETGKAMSQIPWERCSPQLDLFPTETTSRWRISLAHFPMSH